MKQKRALAEIAIDQRRGWILPTFGSKRPYRYWGHARFDGDTNWELEIWTLIIDLPGPPPTEGTSATATVYFMSEDAPHHLICPGARFELSCERNPYTNGVVTRLIEE